MSLLERSLYLYFLDRELGDAVEYRLDSLTARRAVQTLVTATNARLLCGLSLLYENGNFDRSAIEFFADLLALSVLDTISHYLSYDEFKASRIALYEHDAGRYPAYFDQKSVPIIKPSIQKMGGTTANIVTGMTQWAFRIPDTDPRFQLTFTELREPVLTALKNREGRAVTFSLFEPYLGDLGTSPIVRSHVRRVISNLFAGDYLSFGDNDVPTGIRGLAYFEQALSKDFPFYDVQILARLIGRVGASQTLSGEEPNIFWRMALLHRDSEAHTLFVAILKWIISATAEVVGIDQFPGRHDEVRTRVINMIVKLTTLQQIAPTLKYGEDLYVQAASNAMVLTRQLMEDRRMAIALDTSRNEFIPPIRTDVVLIVATETESEAVIEVFKENGHNLKQPAFSSINAYQVFSPVGGARVALVRCSMGPGGPGGPELTVAEAIDVLKPKSVIMLGIAFGVDPLKEQIGQILLSTHVFDYELERAGTDAKGKLVRVSRGAKPDASPRLISRFQAARLHTAGLNVREGVLLSGAKLIDNIDYRDDIRSLCAEAIGGEMEGFGVYSAAARSNVDWIIVKAISDWADGRKRTRKAQRQRQAARNAALAVVKALEHGGFA